MLKARDHLRNAEHTLLYSIECVAIALDQEKVYTALILGIL